MFCILAKSIKYYNANIYNYFSVIVLLKAGSTKQREKCGLRYTLKIEYQK